MKIIELRKIIKAATFGACFISSIVTYAAGKVHLYGNINNEGNSAVLKKFSLVQMMPNHETLAGGVKLAPDLSDHKNSVNTFQLVNGHMGPHHESIVRYNQYYQNIPVWGMQMVYAISPQKTTIVSGVLINDIEQDVPDIGNSMSTVQIQKIALGKNTPTSNVNMEKVIYFDEAISNKAVLAYHVSYATHLQGHVAVMSYFIDGATGAILKEVNVLPTGGNRY